VVKEYNKSNYHKLIVWQKAHTFTVSIYKETKKFPKSELYGLTSQLRRAAVSVTANIVEGQSANSRKGFLRYLYIAKGSLLECQYYLELAKDLDFFSKETYEKFQELKGEIGYLLHRLMLKIKTEIS
jgi:four helix bundle protein